MPLDQKVEEETKEKIEDGYQKENNVAKEKTVAKESGERGGLEKVGTAPVSCWIADSVSRCSSIGSAT